jgi:hypothetical protein
MHKQKRTAVPEPELELHAILFSSAKDFEAYNQKLVDKTAKKFFLKIII